MTCIAWDGKTMAADKLAICQDVMSTVTKIYRVPDGLVGFCGDTDVMGDMLQWFQAGRVAADFPKLAETQASTTALFVHNDGSVLIYTKNAYPIREAEKFYAIGSGRYYALAAMHLGKSAAVGVRTAIALTNTCGRGVDTLTLKGKR